MNYDIFGIVTGLIPGIHVINTATTFINPKKLYNGNCGSFKAEELRYCEECGANYFR